MNPVLFKTFSENISAFLNSKKVKETHRLKIIDVLTEKNNILTEIYDGTVSYTTSLDLKKTLNQHDIYLLDTELNSLSIVITRYAEGLLNSRKAFTGFPNEVLTSIFQYTPELFLLLLSMTPPNKMPQIVRCIVTSINTCKLPILKIGKNEVEILKNLKCFINNFGQELTYIDLTDFGNIINDQILNKIIILCPKIETLKLKSRSITKTSLENLKHLRHLSLENSKMEDEDLSFLTDFTCLESLALRYFENINGDFLKYISKDVLPTDQDTNVPIKGIISIDLTGCTGILLNKFNGKDFTFLDYLSIECHDIAFTFSHHSSSDYFEGILNSRFENLKNLTITGPLMNDEALSKILSKFPKLEILNLKCHKITGEFLKNLKLTTVKTLKLECLKLKDENLEALSQLTSLEVLDIRSPSISGDFIKCLKDIKLREFRLYSDFLTDANLVALQQSRSVKVLDIEAKSVTGEFIKSINLKRLMKIRLISDLLVENNTKLLYRIFDFPSLKIIETNAKQVSTRNKFPKKSPEEILFYEILDPFLNEIEISEYPIFTKAFAKDIISYAKKYDKLNIVFINNLLNVRVKHRLETNIKDGVVKRSKEIIELLENMFFSSLFDAEEFVLAIEFLESHIHIIDNISSIQLILCLKKLSDIDSKKAFKFLLKLKSCKNPKEFDNILSNLIEYELSRNLAGLERQIYLLSLFSNYHKIPSKLAKTITDSIVDFVKDNNFEGYTKETLEKWLSRINNFIGRLIENNQLDESFELIASLLNRNVEEIVFKKYDFHPKFQIVCAISYYLIHLINQNEINKFEEAYDRFFSLMLNDEKAELPRMLHLTLCKNLKEFKVYNGFLSDWLYDKITTLNKEDRLYCIPLYIEFLIKHKKHLEKFSALESIVDWKNIALKDLYKVFPAFFTLGVDNAAYKTASILEKAPCFFNLYECIQAAMANGEDLNALNRFFARLEDLTQNNIVNSIPVKIAKILYLFKQKNETLPSETALVNKLNKEIAFYQENLKELFEIKLFDDSWVDLIEIFRADNIKNNATFDIQRINIIQNILVNQYESQSKSDMVEVIVTLLIQLINNSKIENFKEYFSELFSSLENAENKEFARLFYIKLCKKLDEIKDYNDSFSYWLKDKITEMDGDDKGSNEAYIQFLMKHKRLDVIPKLVSQINWQNISSKTFSKIFPALFSSGLDNVISKTVQMLANDPCSLDLYECIKNALAGGIAPTTIDKFLVVIDDRTKDNLVDSTPVKIAKILYLLKQRDETPALDESLTNNYNEEIKLNADVLFDNLTIIPHIKSWDDLINVFDSDSVKNNSYFDSLRIKMINIIVNVEVESSSDLVKISQLLEKFIKTIKYNPQDSKFNDQLLEKLSSFIKRSTNFTENEDAPGNIFRQIAIEKIYSASERLDQSGDEIKLMIFKKLLEAGKDKEKFVTVKNFMFLRIEATSPEKRTKLIEIFYELLASKPKELPKTSKEKMTEILEKFLEYLKHNEDLSMVYLKCYVLAKEERATIISSLIEKVGDNPFLLEKLCNCFDKID